MTDVDVGQGHGSGYNIGHRDEIIFFVASMLIADNVYMFSKNDNNTRLNVFNKLTFQPFYK